MFAALQRAAADAAGDPALEEYATYCRLREKGLRRQALSHVERLASSLADAAFPRRLAFVSWVLAESLAGESTSDGLLLLPHPLRRRLVEPTLLDWTRWRSDVPEPHFWLGMMALGHGSGRVFPDAAVRHFRDALHRDPSFAPALEQLEALRARFGDDTS